MNKEIKKGFAKARLITKKHAKTFYFASSLLPKDKRYAAYAVYAICRASDDSVDTAKNPKKSLAEIEKNIEAAYSDCELSDSVLLCFRETANSCQIPKEYFDDLIKGMYMDLSINCYKDFPQLYDYCYKVAGVIGLIMLKIFGSKSKNAQKYAVDLGVAMQLTNILRDIKEDFERKRIYLPQDEMSRFKVSQSHISKETIDEDFREFLKFQIKRARKYYKDSEAGIKEINSLSCRLTACLMKDIYSAILKSIEKNQYDVFSKRACVSFGDKMLITLKSLLKGEYL